MNKNIEIGACEPKISVGGLWENFNDPYITKAVELLKKTDLWGSTMHFEVFHLAWYLRQVDAPSQSSLVKNK